MLYIYCIYNIDNMLGCFSDHSDTIRSMLSLLGCFPSPHDEPCFGGDLVASLGKVMIGSLVCLCKGNLPRPR